MRLSPTLLIVFPLSVVSFAAWAQDVQRGKRPADVPLETPSAPNDIQGVAPMGDGFVFTDQNNSAVWTVKPGEAAKIFARGEAWPRTPLYRPSAIAFEPGGRLVVTDPSTGGVIPIEADGKLVESKAPFEVGQTRGIAIDASGNVFVAGSTVDSVFKMTPDGKTTKLADVPHAWGVALLGDGSLVVAQPGHRTVSKVSADGKTVTPLHKGEPFQNPLWVAFDGESTIYVSDNYARAIFRLPLAGGTPTPLAGDFENPAGLWFERDKKRLLAADAVARSIVALTPDGKRETLYQAAK